MGATPLEIIRQLDNLVDGFQIPREQNDAARFVLLQERGQIGCQGRPRESDHKELTDFIPRAQ